MLWDLRQEGALLTRRGNADIGMAFYFTTEMKPVAKWLCARHRELALGLGK